MALEIAAWNAQESLAEPATMPAAIEHIKQLDADVVILSDAYVEMAQGECLEILTNNTDFRDADRMRRVTFPAYFPLLQPDHFIISQHVGVEQIRIGEHLPVSDHRSLSARVII